jgi:hypothetical protein
LKVGKVNDGNRGIAEIENSRIAADADDFDILTFRWEAETNSFSDRVAVLKEAIRKAAAEYGDARAALILGLIEVTG